MEAQPGHVREGPSERIIEYEFDPTKVGPTLWGINSYENPALEIARSHGGLERIFSDQNTAELLLELAEEEIDAHKDYNSTMPEDWYLAAGFHGLHTMADALSRVMGADGTISRESIVIGLTAIRTKSGNTVIEELMSLEVIKDEDGELMYRLGLDSSNKDYVHNPVPIFKSLMNQTVEVLPE